MTIIIGLNEDNKNNITLGIVAKDVFIEAAENTFKYFGYKLQQKDKNLIIYKLDDFRPNIINEFAQDSGFSMGNFTHFICKTDNVLQMIKQVVKQS